MIFDGSGAIGKSDSSCVARPLRTIGVGVSGVATFFYIEAQGLHLQLAVGHLLRSGTISIVHEDHTASNVDIFPVHPHFPQPERAHSPCKQLQRRDLEPVPAKFRIGAPVTLCAAHAYIAR